MEASKLSIIDSKPQRATLSEATLDHLHTLNKHLPVHAEADLATLHELLELNMICLGDEAKQAVKILLEIAYKDGVARGWMGCGCVSS
tara:strand:+ start:3083 stop:3346 length:264 start_codon:yes stop_codon:yes gene_type:complete